MKFFPFTKKYFFILIKTVILNYNNISQINAFFFLQFLLSNSHFYNEINTALLTKILLTSNL